MTTGRKPRLVFAAAILAALFAFVSLGHVDAHAGASASPDPTCAMCSSAADVLAPAPLEAPVFLRTRVAAAPATPYDASAPLSPRSRGPPSIG